MLILVGVSVSVDLQGGIFTKAETASDDTKEAVIREQLQVIAISGKNEKMKQHFDKLVEKTNSDDTVKVLQNKNYIFGGI